MDIPTEVLHVLQIELEPRLVLLDLRLRFLEAQQAQLDDAIDQLLDLLILDYYPDDALPTD